MGSEPDATDAEAARIIPIFGDDGRVDYVDLDDTDPAQRERLRLEAARRKAVFRHRAAGASLRAEALPRAVQRAWADGAVSLLLAQILMQEVKASSAKEAAETAKIIHQIARTEEASAPLADAMKDHKGDRQQMESDVAMLQEEARIRRLAAMNAEAALLGGAVPDGEAVPDVDDAALELPES